MLKVELEKTNFQLFFNQEMTSLRQKYLLLMDYEEIRLSSGGIFNGNS
jgi:hypothetical protein